MQVESRKKWELAMEEEMDSLMHNQTWDLVKFPAGKTTLQNKWVYRLKEEDGGKQRYKARLVVKGFAQKKGIDFDEIFPPVVKMNSIRTILSLLAAEDLHLEQLDVKTSFLHGDLEEEMDSLMHNQTWDLVRLPAGKTTSQNKWVYKLKEEDGGKQRYKARLVVTPFFGHLTYYH